MNLMMSSTTLKLWQDIIRHAENKCAITLEEDLETYLVSLLIRYSNKPEVVKKLVAIAYMEALRLSDSQRQVSLQQVGDQCLIFAGLFPKSSIRRHVKLSYFVDVGQSAYAAISKTTNDLFGSLALEFVVLMDVLQSIGPNTLLPIEAYDQWNELGSRRALNILKEYTGGIPQKSKNQ